MLQSSPNYKFLTRTYPSDTTGARLLVHLLYNGAPGLRSWNNVAVVHQDDAWGKGYVTQMELEFRRNISRTGLEAAEDTLPRTLILFPFTHSVGGNLARALDAVHDSSYSAIVVVVNFASAKTTFANLLEVLYAWPHTTHPLALTPPPAVLRSPGAHPLALPLPFSSAVAVLLTGLESQECTHAYCQFTW